MPQLANERNELYAKHRARGMVPAKAASAAGYATGSGVYTKLEADPEIVTRIAELMEVEKERREHMRLAARESAETVGKMTGMGRAWVIAQLAETAILARQEGVFAEAREALKLIGQEFGMFTGKGVADADNPDALPTTVDLDKLTALTERAGESMAPQVVPSDPDLDASRAMRLIEGHIPLRVVKPTEVVEEVIPFTPETPPSPEQETKRKRF